MRKHLSLLLTMGLLCGPALSAVYAQGEDDPESPNYVEPETMVEESSEPADQESDEFEGRNIEATVSDLEALISLPPQARLGRESDEDLANPRNLFESKEAQEFLLGEHPKFIYIPEGTDPMIIPWVREQIVVAELLSDAEEAFKRAKDANNKTTAQEDALPKVARILESYPSAPNATQAKQLKVQIETFINTMENPVTDGEKKPTPTTFVKLPPWITTNTHGVVLDLENPADSVVLVGDYVLRPGESVDRFPTVVVKEVRSQQVVFEYQDHEFLVIVNTQ